MRPGLGLVLTAAGVAASGAVLAQAPTRLPAPKAAPKITAASPTINAGTLSVQGQGAANGQVTINAGQLTVAGIGASNATHTVNAGQLSVQGLGAGGSSAQVTINAGQLTVVGAGSRAGRAP